MKEAERLFLMVSYVFLGGYYHGKLIFPREFPFKPPSIYMITPNGRFKCNTRYSMTLSSLSSEETALERFDLPLPRLCLSITDFHPDTWNPAWSVSTILTGLLSFMVEKGPTLGSIETSDYTVGWGRSGRAARSCKDGVDWDFTFYCRKDSCRPKAWPSTSKTKYSASCFLM